MWNGAYVVKQVLEKGAYELVDYEGIALVELRNGLYLKKYYAWFLAEDDLLYIIVHLHSIVLVDLWWSILLTNICLLWQMSIESMVYVGFTDGASHHTQNLALVAWVIYTPTGQVLSSRGVCLWPSLNNVAEYSVVIELLCDSFHKVFILLRYVLMHS